MRITAFIICLLAVLSGCPDLPAAYFVEPPPYGAGIQKLGAGWGLSATFDVTEELTAQGVAGPFGNLHVYAVRGLYSFYRRVDWKLYAFFQNAYFSHRYKTAGERDTAFSLGAGLGFEYDWRRDFPDILPLVWNVELGFMTDDLDRRSISGLRIGAGVHYRF